MEPIASDGADHGGIVGAELGRRDADGDRATALELFAEAGIGGDAPGDEDVAGAELAGEAGCFAGEDIDDGLLELPSDFGHGIAALADGVEDGGFEAAEAEVEGAVQPGAGEVERGWPTFEGGFSDVRTAGEGQAEEPPGFVEGFSGGVVAGAADALVLSVATHEDEVGVSAGDDEAEGGELGFGAFDEPVCVDVTFEVIDADERQAAAEGDGARGVVADQETAGEAGAPGAGDGIDVVEGAVRGLERFADDGHDLEQVLAAGDFGDDAAVFCVEVDLGCDDGGECHAAIFDDGRGRLVARRFDRENFHVF